MVGQTFEQRIKNYRQQSVPPFLGQETMDKIFKISDDSGFMGLVNVDKYSSFVKEDWNFNDLRDRVILEMNLGNLLFWSTGQEGQWNVRITNKKTNDKPFRTTQGLLKVTSEKLFLTNYEDLSMAAQYEDEKLPQKHNADLVLLIENGIYNVTINQLFNPENLVADSDQLHFEIILNKDTNEKTQANNFGEIPWRS